MRNTLTLKRLRSKSCKQNGEVAGRVKKSFHFFPFLIAKSAGPPLDSPQHEKTLDSCHDIDRPDWNGIS